jgi:dienelactone hydrolase
MLRKWGLFALGWALILAGALLAHAIQTSGGVRVADVRIPAGRGVMVSGLLYMPPGVDAAHPAPAVLASHGYINTREMQSPFAIELARRGFVVLAMDMTGHGYSGGNVGAMDFGGPAALAWLQAQPGVDRANIGLEGHSMGGAPVLSAAVAQPQGYRSMVLEGSTTGLFGPPQAGTPTYPRNLALVFGQYDEFAGLMWQQARGADLPQSARLRQLFGVNFPVVPGKLYGDPAQGTARVFYNPPVTHPWEHFSRAGVGRAVDWFQRTLVGARAYIDPMDQVWIWKEVGTGIAFVGMVVLMLGTFGLLLTLPAFAGLARPAEPAGERRGAHWLLSLGLTAAIPAASFFVCMKWGALFFPNRLFPQWVHNELLVWALVNALVTLALGFVLRAGRPQFARTDWPRTLALSALTVAMGYVSLVLVDALFKVDYRFWILGLKPLDGPHAAIFAAYLLPWILYFMVAFRALHSGLAVKAEGEAAQLATAALALSGGFAVLLAAQYGCLFATGLLLSPTEPLSTIIAIQFVPLLMVVGVIAAFTYRRTNGFVPGALICAVLVCWYVSAGTATHWSAEFPMNLPGAPRAK